MRGRLLARRVEGAVRSHALQRSFTTGIAFWSPKFGPPVNANPVEFGFHLESELVTVQPCPRAIAPCCV
jgi:hypothetical protein